MGVLAGRTALVTGSSRGLGLLIAGELAERGCAVMLCGRDEPALERALRQLRGRPGEVAATACDLMDPEAPGRLLAAVRERFGAEVDLLVNNAGLIQVGPASAMQEQDFRRAHELMTMAPLRLVQAVLPSMRARGAGSIVMISSIGGRIPAPHLLPYVTAKFALTGLSEGLAAELAQYGIRVTTVLPGLMRTGSHTAAEFAGQAASEYAWFATAASLPLVSMDAGRAARRIVRAVENGRRELVLTPPAKAAVLAHGVAPATTNRLLSLAARLLPSAGGAPEHGVPGLRAAARHPRGGPVHRLTTLGRRAGRAHNEPTAS
ncbi:MULTISPECIES: SDR family NAD(P)-dependent oxidoreductase [Kitasatospora]|uniref:SDR family NAD(P)-dependent oxidoreductase n=1 Tax=Kitasatospora cathayae TaxID=3004092 RepID=A0ABY7PWF7_9ACTN|nr:SDR family NAD(P)-dependent oxidoreductase [Kitasatospora sp. HUAS 3-15]WBP84532.1 SDR family NAD(P)-dependent oxidoreductase [Kitasatospora sp. HUAS 3-15]